MKMNRLALTGSSLAILGVLLVAVLVLSNLLLRGARLDLTENNLYTLSDGTREVLKEIEEPVNLYFYFSDRGTKEMPIRSYALRVREMLEEMASYSGGKLRLQVIDPLPFSEDEDRASGFGLQAAAPTPGAESIYLGLAGTNSTDGQSVIPIFDPNKEAFLEYDVVKLIHSLVVGKKPVVGVIAGISMAGGFDAATRQQRDAWAVYQELGDMFDLRLINADAASTIDKEIETLILVHPKGLSEDIQYAIDQFLMRGGRLAVFVDPHAEMDQSGNDAEDPSMARFASKSSDLPTLFKAWGVQYDPGKLVFDSANALPIQISPGAPPVRHLAILGLGKDSLNKEERATAQLSNVNFSTTGQFTMAEGAALKLVPLVQSSGDSMLEPVDRVKFEMDPARLYDGFKAGNQHLVLAGRLDGKLKTAFPARTGADHLAESKGEAHILLVADTDVLTDRLWVQVQNFFGQKVMNAFANNGDFVINAIDSLAGSSALISIRGRATSARPFTTVEAIKRQADQNFRLKEQELQQELDETERKLTELQRGKDNSTAMIMSPEQQSEVMKFQAQKVQIRKDLRKVKRQLDADIERLGNWLKVINIILVPLLLTLAAIGFHFWRKRRTATI
jgi:ABC-type uncharacterized transport system involved in gliding motility auxiliary subunit